MVRLLFTFLISVFAFASAISFKTFSNQQIIYSFAEVCHAYRIKHLPLVERESYRVLNCMGTKVDIMEFCFNKHGSSPMYTKGFIPKNQEKVICEKSGRVTIQYQCLSENDERCLKPEHGCNVIKEQLARNLSISHSSSFQKNLRCEYSAIANIKTVSPIGDFQNLIVPVL